MKVLLTGGGTLGPVTPLLAVAEAWKASGESVSFVWVGTPNGPERTLVEGEGIVFYTLPVARFPRYVSIEWLTLPFKLVAAVLKALHILGKEKPDLVGSAGGFTAVPMIVAAKIKRIPIWVHQQDAEVILTNKLTAPFASLVTVAWEKHLASFSKKQTKWIGNPVRKTMLGGSVESARKRFELNAEKKTLFLFAGGTGSRWLNEMMAEVGASIADYVNVIHLTGPGKMLPQLNELHTDYTAYELFVDEMADALAVADLVVCRAGLGTITELAALRKAAVLIPLPNSPQEDNAFTVQSAAVAVSQGVTSELFQETILSLMADDEEREVLGTDLGELLKTDVAEEIIAELKQITKTRS